MKKWNHNDYEVIDRIKEGDEDAFEFMVSKYHRFIAKKIHKFNLAYDFDDTYQEGLIILYKTVLKFDPSFNKTFTRFFEMSFERFLITKIDTRKRRKDKVIRYRDSIAELNHCIHETSVYYPLQLREALEILSPLEQTIFIEREIKNNSIEYIAQAHKIETKRIYNGLQRAKVKIHAHFGKE